jgi:hypothetical protein
MNYRVGSWRPWAESLVGWPVSPALFHSPNHPAENVQFKLLSGYSLPGLKLCTFYTTHRLKGQCHEIFCFWFFSWISFPPAPEYSIKTVSNFFENSRRYSQLKVCHRCQRHRWQMEKIFNPKNFNNFVWSPLGSRGNMYINFCLQVRFQVSAAWYCSHYLPPVSLTPVVHLTKKFEMILMLLSGAWGKVIHEKSKNLVTLSL